MGKHQRRAASRPALLWSVVFAGLALCALEGCGVSGSTASVEARAALHGTVHGGQQPVIGASVQIYAAGTSGPGSGAQPLLADPARSDNNGNFSVPASYFCPSVSSQIYVVARGGTPVVASGASNSAVALMAMLGSCGGLSATTPILLNEVTTVGSVWPLAPYMTSLGNLGSSAGDAGFMAAISTVDQFINLAQGSSPGQATATSYFAQNSKLYSLADVLADCVNSSGGSAGDGSPCGLLFAIATPPGGNAPTDTATAALLIAQHPGNNVTNIFSLAKADTSYQPTLTSTPADWTLTLNYLVATPFISVATGSYTATQEVAISDSTAGSTVYYTTDGTAPTSSSPLYTGPISIAISSTVQAIAVLKGSQSAVASSTLTITSAHTPAKLAFLQQPSNASTQAAMSPAVQVVVEDESGNAVATAANPVTLALTGSASLGGTLTAVPQNGVAVFSNLTVSTAGSGYTLSASSPGLVSAVSNAFSVASPVTPTIALSLSGSTIETGSTLAGNLTLNQPAGSGGINVQLSSSAPSVMSVTPTVLTVAAGQTSASFTYSGISVGSSTLSAASPGYGTATAQISDVVPAIPTSLFGLSFLNFTQVSPPLQYSITRSWDVYPEVDWGDANPSAGVYDFRNLDSWIAVNQARGTEMIYTLGRTPLWASSMPAAPGGYNPGDCAPPSNMSDWDNYLTAIATHVAGKIKYWEMWNEPNNPTGYCGDIPTLVTMTQHANDIIKAINPAAIILSPACNGGDFGNGPPWLGTFLGDGGAAYVDVIAFHGYGNGTAEDINTDIVPRFQSYMAANNAGGKPMWDTESDWSSINPNPALAQQTSYVAKSFLLHWSAGVSRFLWYAYDGNSRYGELETSAGPTTAATAYAQVQDWMVGATMSTGCVEDSNTHVWTCALTRSGGYSAEAVWISNSAATLNAPAQYIEYRDLAGVVHPIVNGTIPVGDMPVLLESGGLP